VQEWAIVLNPAEVLVEAGSTVEKCYVRSMKNATIMA
jgi:hypothetical protein